MTHSLTILGSTFSQRLRTAMIAAVGLAVALTVAVSSDAQAAIPAAGTYAWTNSAWVETSNTTISTKSLDVKGTVYMPYGVKSFKMSFSGDKASSCTTNGGAVYTGSFYVSLPATQVVYPSTFTSKVTRYATIAAPKCSVNGQAGVPYGHSFTMTVEGTGIDGFQAPASVTKNMTIKVV